MLRFLEIGLIGAVCAAVLAFGGTAPSFFFATQVIVLSLGVLLLLAGQRSRVAPIHLPVAVPLFLIVLVLLQILPLPASAAPLFGRTLEDLAGRSYFTVSIAQYQTLSHLLLLVTYLTAFFLTLVVCQYRSAKKRLLFALRRFLAVSCRQPFRSDSHLAFAHGHDFGPGFTYHRDGPRWNFVVVGANKGNRCRTILSRRCRACGLDWQRSCN